MNEPNQIDKWKQRVVMMLLLLCVTVGMFAQKISVRGNVKDEKGEAVIGATVQLKGTTLGTITDIDGNFTISLNNAGKDVLQISFIGYETQEVPVKGQKMLKVTLSETYNELQEVTVVGYGTQKKETLTGAISSMKTEALLRSPNTSIANSLAGQITGLSSVASSGQPGNEDPKIFIRGAGSLTEGASSPLILVDGVERSFFQMDPNEIESVTVLKDASATAVFGVRGANGVVLVTTRRGEEGKAKIQLTSSIGVSHPTRILEMADSYTYATLMNERDRNDGAKESFDEYALERFRLHDDPILYPDVKWRDYLMKKAALQTQHNLNVSGGTKDVRYFISLGFLSQDGLLKQLTSEENNNFKYQRYNYRSNLDINMTSTTVLKLGLGGRVGVRQQPNVNSGTSGDLFKEIDWAQPFSSPGLVGGQLVSSYQGRFPNILLLNPLADYFGRGSVSSTSNVMNMDLSLTQKLDFVTKGLSFEVKGAYNTSYTSKINRWGSVEILEPYYASEVDGSFLDYDDPLFDKSIRYKVTGKNERLSYSEDNKTRSRDWYLEASLRYNRKFGNHNVGALLLYNQSKKYYPSSFTEVPLGYVGLVGRATYDYKSRYMAEFNVGYNGSENFAPDQRYGLFPAFSLGYVLSEEEFMKKQQVINYLKIRASVGLVGNDNINNNRFLYLANGYWVDNNQVYGGSGFKDPAYGYNFGYNTSERINGAIECRLGNPNTTWEKALKQNYGLDVNFLNDRLRISADVFFEKRKDILIQRNTIPVFYSLTNSLVPVVNYGRVDNKGYELEVKWNDQVSDVNYWVTANMSYSKNKIIEQDEVTPNEPYMWRTGKSTGTVFGYVFERFYREDDFNEDGSLKEGYARPSGKVFPGDCKYADLNNDNIINQDDTKDIGYPTRPAYTFGLNYGVNYKGWSLTMNWAGAAQRTIVLANQYRAPFAGEGRGLMQYHVDGRWTLGTAETAIFPRFASSTSKHNTSETSSIWMRNGNYLRLKTLQLGYTFNQNPVLKKIGISQLGITFSGYNLLTFDHFKIMDPESNPNGNSTYPVSKIYNLGLNVTF